MKIVKKQNVGVQIVYNTNVSKVNNYVGNGVINHNCIIDETYQGEIGINIHNVGNTIQAITPGQKIIQFILIPVLYDTIDEVNNIDELYNGLVTSRGSGGFGSSGLN